MIPYNSEKILFKTLIEENRVILKDFMKWENYDLNNTTIPVIELIKEHALMVLEKSYGLFHVEQTILDSLINDVFIYFPILLQQLAITRLIDGFGVVKDDTDTVQTVRTETSTSETDENNIITQGTSQLDTNIVNNQSSISATSEVDGTSVNIQNNNVSIENSSNLEATGTRNVTLSHNMPEQALNNTGNFPKDGEGTPILDNSYAQQAQEGFTTSNPIVSIETSEQVNENTSNITDTTLTNNNSITNDTGNTNRTITNSGSDMSDTVSLTNVNNSVNETVTSITTNKQYAYEIKAFLETADSLIAFKKWENNFAWVVGII